MPIPQPLFDAGPGEEVWLTIDALAPGDDSWERTMVQRLIKTGFLIPVKIRFPELATALHYQG